MKMSFEPAARKVNQQCRMHHLRSGDDITRDRLTRPDNHQSDWARRDKTAQKDRSPDVRVDVAFKTLPRPRRNPNGDGDAGDPLKK